MNRVIRVSFLLSIAAVFILHAAYLGVVAEDAFISFRFAKNLTSGKGLIWNVGEPPVEGYTNFLWILLCVAGLFARLDVALFSQYLGVAASLATLAYVFLFCRRLLGLGPYMSLIPCAFLACAGPFATWATSGMEMNLFTLLVVSACYHEVSYWNQRRKTSLSLAFSQSSCNADQTRRVRNLFDNFGDAFCQSSDSKRIQGGEAVFSAGCDILSPPILTLLHLALLVLWLPATEHFLCQNRRYDLSMVSWC